MIDPDKFNPDLIKLANNCNVAYIFVGGSLLIKNTINKIIKSIKTITQIPVIIFPGDFSQLSKLADGILIPSLLSGRNTDYLIEKHVKAATKLKSSKLKTIPLGYILVGGGFKSTTEKVTKTKPLISKKEIINTAIAGELLGKKIIYLEAGSGAKHTVLNSIIKDVKKQISIPLIVGGGIDSVSKAKKIIKTNPDYLVIGNALEKMPQLILELSILFNS